MSSFENSSYSSYVLPRACVWTAEFAELSTPACFCVYQIRLSHFIFMFCTPVSNNIHDAIFVFLVHVVRFTVSLRQNRQDFTILHSCSLLIQSRRNLRVGVGQVQVSIVFRKFIYKCWICNRIRSFFFLSLWVRSDQWKFLFLRIYLLSSCTLHFVFDYCHMWS